MTRLSYQGKDSYLWKISGSVGGENRRILIMGYWTIVGASAMSHFSRNTYSLMQYAAICIVNHSSLKA